MHEVFLLLGSNLGDRQLFMKQAIDQIESVIAPVLKKSSVYETQSWGKTDAPDYLNQVILLKTAFNPNEVLEKVLNIENRLGRRREEKWGSRTIDIDILLYDQQIINDPGLIIPHPELQKRRFTLEPLAEIAADTMHPVLKKNILQLKFELIDELNVKKI
ncbi:2-amino-4-hydroxy-6-hydroxymethyldihydropteridine diphosphokinase [Mucilaginibacter gotjawali]|uniref:2-amino-4-hydroxy-6-hydroxymethyldihydropteridine pyrophosphokinase n=1 Tax=Mucilaginibacter gotjawali TaxID=1550579 RepID=A0A839SH21_9SPHI|nr:2-amino-4-hydroxy-6-hydroxymethyldihydropteridine diphosphokinase [Mucilaginibacter gotjawali]MBB3057575.1 2-amino-4-hydroxy-6-hydroxymethyldihydropteridine diphosphokinase [Mucilaginibacter gotjawali]